VSAAPSTVSVPRRFCGPPAYGNGGYCCGLFAAPLGHAGAAEVTLRRPVPLETSFELRAEDDTVTALDPSGALVAEARRADPLGDLEPPIRPDPEAARAASAGSPFRHAEHPYPGCFVCGPAHPSGLGIHVGALPEDPKVAADTFVADESLPAREGALAPELVWAALDCPSYAPSLWTDQPVLLGRLTAELLEPVPIGEELVAVGWETGQDGRKLHSASAVLDGDGRTLARAAALWIRVAAKPA
jgi:hypothetical protein